MVSISIPSSGFTHCSRVVSADQVIVYRQFVRLSQSRACSALAAWSTGHAIIMDVLLNLQGGTHRTFCFCVASSFRTSMKREGLQILIE